jgi:hypothetical protein
VLKVKAIVVLPFDKANESAGVPFTVKSLAWTVARSAGSLRSMMKSVGAEPVTTPPQVGLVTEQPVGVGVGVGLGAAAQYLPPVFK